MHFLEWELLYFDNFIEICSQVLNEHYSSIGSDYGLVLVRQQAIIWIWELIIDLTPHIIMNAVTYPFLDLS